MGENVIQDPLKELEGVTDDDLLTWVKANYSMLRTICEENDLPKPPPW